MTAALKRVALTQRVDVIAGRNESRDALDQRWSALLGDLGAIAVPLPNRTVDVAGWCRSLGVDAAILTGGNDLVGSPDARATAPERDALELALLQHCLEADVPVLGVCRGMEMINHWRGGRLRAVRGHVACRHALTLLSTDLSWPQPAEVNSYHDVAIPLDGLGEGLEALALAGDGTVEAVRLAGARCHGIMWHPEREAPFRDSDLELIAHVLELAS